MAIIMYDTDEIKSVVDKLNAQKTEIDNILRSMSDRFRLERVWEGIDYVAFTGQVLVAMNKLHRLKNNIGNYADNLDYARKVYETANEQVASMIATLN